ncbi:TRAP transporter substrate-binding protein DctP [Aestuariivirga sp.]|uniref:TRAP transporter substrate-binding protein DctP n=1 Tax=Aestuariivirga sp. TaxID=2650926 RepID=UPI003592FF5E
MNLTRRTAMAATLAAFLPMAATTATAQEKVKLRLSSVNSATDQRAVALDTKFGPAIADFAVFEPHWGGALFKQGTELEAISRGNLEMSIASAQELSNFFPEFSVFTAGYLHRDAAHQVAVFNDALMQPFKDKVESELGVKLLAVMYLGRRQINLRTENEVKTPADLNGIKLRMPPSEAWQFLGTALGANPVPVPFAELYTALQTGAVDGQDNPLPTVMDAKFYEVTKQIVLTSHLVDLNYLTLSKKVWDSLSPENQAKLQKAADDAAEFGRQNQLAKEVELVEGLKAKGLKVYEPDLDAFRTTVQKAYLESEFSKVWPAGIVDKINALAK